MKNKIPYNDQLNCLIVQPKYSAFNYWNFVDACEAIGAKTPAPPLGLLTVAALLPQSWTFNLVDLNVEDMNETLWEKADIICVGGMLPQQAGILEIIHLAQNSNKYVVVGGADPSSQPEIYAHADTLVMGEGEMTIPLWLDAWRKGEGLGRFQAAERPDVSTSPIPRYDLVNFNNYMHVGVQFSRGCPFNCEFCDIIELYGRKPRSKTPEQFMAELDRIYELGYRGWVDIVDDNFIGNKRNIKKLLEALEVWCKKRRFPFFFSTEASMNLADDKKLLELMRNVEFRYVFMGIETPDPTLLLATQKSQNTMHPIVDRVHQVYKYGIAVSAGYILGFDNEKPGIDRAMIDCIENSGTIMSMVGLLVALPNTQLARRLAREGRLLFNDTTKADTSSSPYRVKTAGSNISGADQTAAGLNFITTRDRVQIFDEYAHVISEIYNPRAFLNRILRTTRMLKLRRRHIPSLWELRRNLRGLWNVTVWMTKNSGTRYLFWRNIFLTSFMGIHKFEFAMTMMGSYLHMHKQTEFLLSFVKDRRTRALTNPESVDSQVRFVSPKIVAPESA